MADEKDPKQSPAQGGDDNTPRKLNLSPEDQELVNAQIQARLARQEKSLRDQFTTERSALEEQLNAIRTEFDTLKSAATTKKDGDDDTSEQVKAMREQHRQQLEAEQNKAKTLERKLQEISGQFGQLQENHAKTLKTQAMREAMHGLGFHKPEEVELLTSGKVIYDEATKSYLVKENGVVKENTSLEPMTLREFYEEYAAKNPWHVNAELAGGAGSTPGSKQTGTITRKSQFKTTEEKVKWIAANGRQAFEDLPL